MCNKVRDFLLLPFFPIGEEHKDAVTLTACDSHKLDMCAGTIRVLASGSFAVCLCQRGTKQQPWIPTGPRVWAFLATWYRSMTWLQWAGCPLACLQRTWSMGRRPQEYRSQESHWAQHSGAENCRVVSSLRCIALWLGDEAGCRATSQYFCLESALRGAVCLDQQWKHALNSL